VRRQLEFAHRAARDGARVVEDQLAAAMDRAGRLRALPGEVVVTELLAELEGAYQAMRRNERVELVVSAQDDLPVLFIDGHLLLLALRNLVSQRPEVHRRGRGAAHRGEPRQPRSGARAAVVRRVAELLDGELALESEPGKGTRVTLALPVGSAQ
jgi:signal transduction histidine kinase